MSMITRRAALGAAAALPLAAGAARSQAPVSFAGQTIEWIIPFAEAGGSDVWARFLAPFVSRHLPGRPNVVIRNIPGGGSITGANEFAQRARPDGLTFFGASASTQLPFLLGDRRVRYDYAAWTPLVAGPTGGVVYVRPELGVRGAGDIARLRAARPAAGGVRLLAVAEGPVQSLGVLRAEAEGADGRVLPPLTLADPSPGAPPAAASAAGCCGSSCSPGSGCPRPSSSTVWRWPRPSPASTW